METEIRHNIADVLIHVDENMDSAQREVYLDELRGRKGVVSVSNNEKTAHLYIVKYDPEQINSSELLADVTKKGVHAELVGI